MNAARLVVCVPARNEAERLPGLMNALALQTVRSPVVVALNNTTDSSLDVMSHLKSRYPALEIEIDEITFAPADAHAGSARRRAMDLAADLAGPSGLVLTTDADTRPPPDWIAQNSAALACGIDLASGRIVIDDTEMQTDDEIAASGLADRYWSRVRKIEDAIDPVAWDPPPRHGDHTGASLCTTVAAYRQCGGVPTIPSGEDRALVRAVLRQGGRLAHPPGIWTRVSPRTVGRAHGGMADHMLRLRETRLAGRDIMLPSFAQWRQRAEWRRQIRAQGGGALVAQLEDALPPMIDDMALTDRALRCPD